MIVIVNHYESARSEMNKKESSFFAKNRIAVHYRTTWKSKEFWNFQDENRKFNPDRIWYRPASFLECVRLYKSFIFVMIAFFFVMLVFECGGVQLKRNSIANECYWHNNDRFNRIFLENCEMKWKRC